jgi:hypothetical protein
MCVYKKIPVPANQNKVLELIFENKGMMERILLPSRWVADTGLYLVHERRIDINLWEYSNERVDRIFMADVNTLEVDELKILYYCASLNLCSKLVLGRNKTAFDKLLVAAPRLGVSFLDLYQIATCSKVACVIRSYAWQLLMQMYVDIEPQSEVPMVRPNYIRSSVMREVDTTRIMRKKRIMNPYEAYDIDKYRNLIPPSNSVTLTRDASLHFFKEIVQMQSGLDALQIGQVKLCSAVVWAAHMLLLYGLFHKRSAVDIQKNFMQNWLSGGEAPHFDKLREMTDAFLELIEPRNDVPPRLHEQVSADEVADPNWRFLLKNAPGRSVHVRALGGRQGGWGQLG